MSPVAKVTLLRATALVPCMLNMSIYDNIWISFTTDLSTFLTVKCNLLHLGEFNIWVSFILYSISYYLHIYHQLWQSALYKKITGWIDILLDKLLMHTSIYEVLGGIPTTWQKSKTTVTNRSFKRPKPKQRVSSPGKKANKGSPLKKTNAEKLAQEDDQLAFKDNVELEEPEKVRLSMTSDEISSILKDVYYTANTTFESIFNNNEDEEIEITFQNSCSSFKLLMCSHIEKDNFLSMELVWEELINVILANFDCIIKLSNLELSLDGSPKCSIRCKLTACSIWSFSENRRYFYSKLQKEKLEREESYFDKPNNDFKIEPLKQLKSSITFKNSGSLESIRERTERTTPDKSSRSPIQEKKQDSLASPLQSKDPPFIYEELISVMVHDMRSPLMCILGNLELIDFEMKQQASYPLVEPLIKSSMSASALLENLVSDILDAARISKGIFRMNPTKLNLEETIKECFSIVELAAKAKHINLHMIYESKLKIITSDKHRIKQVILNFLSNSIKFTQNGDIWLRVKDKINTLQIQIEDTGEGISSSFLPSLFTKFKSDNKSKNNSQGIGLGLFICKSLISKLGPNQKIGVKSELSKGTSFTFEIFKNLDQISSPRQVASHEQSYLRKYANGSIGCVNNKANSTKEIAFLNYYSKPKTNVSIFALNHQPAMESRRLIQTKMKWDISWVTEMKDGDTKKRISPEHMSFLRTESERPIKKYNHSFKPLTQKDMSNKNKSNKEYERSLGNISDLDQLYKQSHGLIKATLDEDSEGVEDDGVEISLSVLIVDDEPFILELLSDFFIIATSDLNMNVVEDSAPDIQTTAEKMENKDYDLVMIDCYLPDGTGPAFVSKFVERRKAEGGKIPLFALSTGADIDDIRNEANPDIFFRILTKPITLKKFKELLIDVKRKKKSELK